MADVVEQLEQEAAAIRERIEPKRAEIAADEQQLARIEAALEILRGNVALATGSRRATATTARRTDGGIDEDAIVAFVGANQPVAAREIGEHIGVKGNRLSVKLGRMVNARVLTKTGERRGTRYSVA